jgi:shikimate dehydrogenase
VYVLNITGQTQIFPIVGHPVNKVFSPTAFNLWFKENDVNCCMVALDIPADGLSGFLSLLRGSPSFRGCSITYPHKQAALQYVDALTPQAERLGALNTIRREPDGRLVGDATDGKALVAAVRAGGGCIIGQTAMILGAGGGAGMAITDAFCAAGVGRLILTDTDIEREKQAHQMVSTYWPEVEILDEARDIQVLVNATALGSKPSDPCPFDTQLIANADIVCDVVSGQKLVEAAKAFGTRLINGFEMGQAQVHPQLSFLGLTQ